MARKAAAGYRKKKGRQASTQGGKKVHGWRVHPTCHAVTVSASRGCSLRCLQPDQALSQASSSSAPPMRSPSIYTCGVVPAPVTAAREL